MKILQQNKKMKKANYRTYNFSLPAVDTCPGAGVCASAGYCFALLEQLRYKSALDYRQRMYALSKTDDFMPTVLMEIERLHGPRIQDRRPMAVRVHASGDFYNAAYMLKWFRIAEARPDVQFYAYTKSIVMAKRLQHQVPPNFQLILSEGSNQDDRIDRDTDRHARIFASQADALAAGYTLADEDDSVAWQAGSNRIGLVMFGARKNKGNRALANQ